MELSRAALVMHFGVKESGRLSGSVSPDAFPNNIPIAGLSLHLSEGLPEYLIQAV